MNVAQLFTDQARQLPERAALKLDEVTVSHQELADASARVAALLAARGLTAAA